MGTAAGDVRQVSMSGAGLVSFASAGTVELRCRQLVEPTPSGADPQIKLADITAVRIRTVTQSEGS